MSSRIAYCIAILVVIIWGTTFTSTKVLLSVLTPVEIMVCRYVLGYLALWIAYPKWHTPSSLKEESCFLAAGFLGGTLYFYTENYALNYTLTANVGLLVAAAPIFTAVAARCILHGHALTRPLVFGFLTAFVGVFLVIFNGHFVLQLSPLGDFLALAAALSWAIYCIIIKTLPAPHGGLHLTRKVFFYSLLTMAPLLFTESFRWTLAGHFSLPVLANLAFLGVVASALCFVLWSKVIWCLGPVQANNFIYLVPLVTMLTAAIVLKESLTLIAILGGGLILSGVYAATAGEGLFHRFRRKAPE